MLPATLMADSTTFVDGTPGVGSAINSGGFFVSDDTSGLSGAQADVSGFHLDATGPGYSDAGLVLYLDGGLTLGQLVGVSVDATGSPLAVNLWLDTGGDGSFFAFGGVSGNEFTGLNGDSYAGCGAPSISATSSCYMLGGDGAGGTFTLSQLQEGLVPGIGADTPTALWIGITSGGEEESANINSITVSTVGSVPEPASIMLLGTVLVGLVGAVRPRRRR
jgi:hypothetical protein